MPSEKCWQHVKKVTVPMWFIGMLLIGISFLLKSPDADPKHPVKTPKIMEYHKRPYTSFCYPCHKTDPKKYEKETEKRQPLYRPE